MLIHMVSYNLVKRKIRFRSQKSNFLRVFRERLFPRSEVHLVTLPELALFGFLRASRRNKMLDQSLRLVTPSHSALVHLTLDNLFIYGDKAMHEQEAFWRRESQSIKYPPSDAQLPSWSKGSRGKPEVGSIQAGRRVSQTPAFCSASSQPCQPMLHLFLEACLFQDACPAHPSEAAVGEWRGPDWESGVDAAPKCMTSYKSLSLREPQFPHP